MIQYVVRTTAVLLALSAVLVIVGLFDAFLDWDIFGQSTEALLYGVFFSCITLAAVGIALTFVLGIHEIVVLFRASIENRPVPPAPRSPSFGRIATAFVAAMTVILVSLGLVNRQVQEHRNGVFQELAARQAEHFESKAIAHLPSSSPPSPAAELDQAMATLQNLDLLQAAKLYLADLDDPDALWVYQRSWTEKQSHFERRFAAKTHEVAVVSAMAGSPDALENFNAGAKFSWLHLLPGKEGPSAVLFLIGNQQEDLRAYSR